MVLRGNEHGSLTHACHIDCSRITTFLPNELAAALDRGSISRGFAAQIVSFIALVKPKTLSEAHQQLIIANLGMI
jgi:hypothetical protein